VAPHIRDEIVAFVGHYAARTGLAAGPLLKGIGIGRDRYADWQRRAGQANGHTAHVPSEHWLETWEQQAIREFFLAHPQEGYRRLTWMMVDRGLVAASPSSVYRVLKKSGLLGRGPASSSKKGQGFEQPLKPHEHWHSDVSYLNVGGTFYYFIGVIDGASRYLVHWEIREAMTTRDIQIVLQRAHEKYPQARPRIISDNGPQYLAHEFKEFIRQHGMTHVRTSPYYPQSNGKIERFHGSLKRECIRPKTPVSLEDARAVVGRYVEDYNGHRLHGAIGYVTPRDRLEGRSEAIWAERKRKLRDARQRRQTQTGLAPERSCLIEGGRCVTV
jgi:transposase InsO family protein